MSLNKIPRTNYIRNALEYFTKVIQIYKCLKGGEKASRFARSFNTRARDGPQTIRDQGLIPYLTYLASKAGEELIKTLYDDLSSDNIRCDKIDSPEKAGYAAYFNAIVKYLEILGIITKSKGSVINVINGILSNIGNYRVMEPIILNYLIELKKLSSSYFKEVE